jgi:hypothetical protein
VKNINKKKTSYTVLARITEERRTNLKILAKGLNDTVSNLIRGELHAMLEKNGIKTEKDVIENI